MRVNISLRKADEGGILYVFRLTTTRRREIFTAKIASISSGTAIINDYMDGVYTKEEAVKRLLPQNLTDQYAFLTETALALLLFEGGEQLL